MSVPQKALTTTSSGENDRVIYLSGREAERPWARHYQDEWLERSGDISNPLWLRVACLAYGSHANNGHAMFKRGQVALILAKVDPETGTVTTAHRNAVYKAIERAIDGGWLAEGSTARCLIVPAHAVRKGPMGGDDTPCPIHTRKARR